MLTLRIIASIYIDFHVSVVIEIKGLPLSKIITEFIESETSLVSDAFVGIRSSFLLLFIIIVVSILRDSFDIIFWLLRNFSRIQRRYANAERGAWMLC